MAVERNTIIKSIIGLPTSQILKLATSELAQILIASKANPCTQVTKVAQIKKYPSMFT